VLSDILGNHQINIYTDLFYNIKNSNFQLAYFYLPKRIDFGGAVFHYSYPFYTYFVQDGYLYWGYIRDRNYGVSFYSSRPFDRYRRLDFGLTGLGIDRDLVAIDPYYAYYGYSNQALYEMGNLYKRRICLIHLGYTTDTVMWGMTGPVNGGRSNISVSYSPSVSKTYGLDFWSARGDWRKYFRIKRDYSFALRFSGGLSGGRNPQRFFLGGMRNWINYKYRDIPEDLMWEDLFYFSSFETPLRGSPYYEMIGTRFILTNMEFRFPLIRYLLLGWPLPLGLQNVRGVVFLDVGSAWENDKMWMPFKRGSFGLPKLNDMRAGYGFGARLNLGFILIRYDVAWATDFASSADKPIHYFSLGAEF
jgi:outer membrane protein assembly factor BamA